MDFSRHSIALLHQLGLWKLFNSDKFRLLGLGKLPNIVRASLVNALFIALQDCIFSFIFFCKMQDFFSSKISDGLKCELIVLAIGVIKY